MAQQNSFLLLWPHHHRKKSIYLQQQWGIWIIFISFPILFIDAKLTRQRDRATNETARDRNRATGARERQRRAIALLYRSAVLTARFQLEPNEFNRNRLNNFLALIEK